MRIYNSVLMNPIERKRVNPIECLGVSITINVLVNFYIVKLGLSGYKYQELSQNLFIIAYAVWQIVNIMVCVYCAVEQELASAFVMYLKVNQYIIACIGSSLAIFDLIFWSILHCRGDYCLMVDILFAAGLVVVLAVGITGVAMTTIALKLCNKPPTVFVMVSSTDK